MARATVARGTVWYCGGGVAVGLVVAAHKDTVFCISLNCVLFFKSLKLSDLNCLFSMSLARYQIPFLA